MFFRLDNNMLFEKLLIFQDLVPATSIINGGSLHEENKIKRKFKFYCRFFFRLNLNDLYTDLVEKKYQSQR